MFEGALVESRGLVASRTVRWTATASVAVQCALAALLIALPLLRPDAMPMLHSAPQLVIPTVPKAPPPMPHVRMEQAANTTALSQPQPPVQVDSVPGRMRQILPGPIGSDAPGPVGPTSLGMSGSGPALPSALTGTGPTAAVVRAAPAGPVRVSSGVSSGMLLTPIQPVYPPIAKAAGIQGTVVIEAVISPAGRIESLHAVSGPEMLRGAAIAAVEQARYQPYRLSGQPVEVQTTITVNFRLGS